MRIFLLEIKLVKIHLMLTQSISRNKRVFLILLLGRHVKAILTKLKSLPFIGKT